MIFKKTNKGCQDSSVGKGACQVPSSMPGNHENNEGANSTKLSSHLKMHSVELILYLTERGEGFLKKQEKDRK